MTYAERGNSIGAVGGFTEGRAILRLRGTLPIQISTIRGILFLSFFFSLAACGGIPANQGRVVGSVPTPGGAEEGLTPKSRKAPLGSESASSLERGRVLESPSATRSPDSQAETSERPIIGRLYRLPERGEPPYRPSKEPAEREEPEGDTRVEKESDQQIPIVLNAGVRRFIRYFTGPHRATFARWLERSTRYKEMMWRILREEGVPEDLVYVALIESGFNPKAYSWAGASGIWQFMRATARKYGLVVNWWIDERRDPVKSTRAAARYFKDLHNMFRSWYLAQAGYNAGEGRIQRGLNRLKKRKDFWTLAKTRYIGRETRNFVPKFVAASIIAKNPEAYGFQSLSYQAPIQYEEVPVPRPTDLRWIASAARVSMKEIQQLNPGLRRWRTPPKYPGYKIKVPPGTARQVAAAVRDWRPNLFVGRKYRIQRGDTLGRIARDLGTTVEALAEINGLSDPGRIYVGQNLILPAETQTAAKRGGSSPPGGPMLGGSPEERPSVHIVRSGETLWGISRRYGMSLGNLISWNRLPKDGRIRPGDKIRLSPEGFLEPKSSRLKRPSLIQGG